MKKYLPPVAALFLSAFGFANSAEAGYAITLDNYGNSGIPNWAGTAGTITIATKINGVWEDVCELTPVSSSAAHWCYVSSVFGWEDVDGIWIRTDSSDGFFLDQFSLWERTGPLTYDLAETWGVDNNEGWCLSTAAENPSQYCPHGWSSGWWWTF